MTCQESEWWDEVVSIWGFLFGDSRPDCLCCGADLPHTKGFFTDGETLKCDDCGSTNVVSVDQDEAYLSHYICSHGKRDEDFCVECEDA